MDSKDVFILNDDILKKPIIIFGTGNIGKRAYYTLLKYGISIKCFADKVDNSISRTMLGKNIISEEQLINEDCNVIVASLFWNDILRRLDSKGIKNIYVMNLCGIESDGINL